MTIREIPFGEGIINQFVLETEGGLGLSLLPFGATLISVRLPDRLGRKDDVVLGFNTLKDYQTRRYYFGPTIGRYANRIAEGSFELEGKRYVLARNDGSHHLHGGETAFDQVFWKSRPFSRGVEGGVVFEYQSRDGEEGYPGNMDVRVTYTITEDARLRMDYEARSDAPTPVSMTNHAYWNLAGAGGGPVLDHELELSASSWLPSDEGLIPTGEIAAVDGGPMDFRAAKPMGRDIERVPGGYDHCWVWPGDDTGMKKMAHVRHAATGREFQLYSDQPGLQFYSGNFLDGVTGRDGRAYAFRGAFCLEPQEWPDSPNRPAFPDVMLRPGDTYRRTIEYRFRWDG